MSISPNTPAHAETSVGDTMAAVRPAEGLSQNARYAPTSRLIHWAVAALVLVVWPLGFVIEFVQNEAKTPFYFLHESFGFLILWLMLVRVVVRMIRGTPPQPPMPRWQKITAESVHGLLYVALFLQPIFGFLATNAFGFPLDWFGLVTVWSPVGKSETWAPIFMGVHVALGYAILILFVLHLGGVLHHHLLKRDATLYRMI